MSLTSRSRILIDDAVGNAVLDLIREAKEQVVLVSPYNRFWRHLKDAIHEALQRDVRVTVVYRQEKDNDGNKILASWLLEKGGDVYEVEWLHAKIYLNESSLLVTSMNLLESSSKNSWEVAYASMTERARGTAGLCDQAHRPWQTRQPRRSRHRRGTPALSRTSPSGRAGRRPGPARSKAVKATGHCIRCGKTFLSMRRNPCALPTTSSGKSPTNVSTRRSVLHFPNTAPQPPPHARRASRPPFIRALARDGVMESGEGHGQVTS